MFVDPKSEDRILERLRVLVEEFGPDCITIYLPVLWEQDTTIGVKTLFSTVDEVIIEVCFNGEKTRHTEKVLPYAAK